MPEIPMRLQVERGCWPRLRKAGYTVLLIRIRIVVHAVRTHVQCVPVPEVAIWPAHAAHVHGLIAAVQANRSRVEVFSVLQFEVVLVNALAAHIAEQVVKLINFLHFVRDRDALRSAHLVVMRQFADLAFAEWALIDDLCDPLFDAREAVDVFARV